MVSISVSSQVSTDASSWIDSSGVGGGKEGWFVSELDAYVRAEEAAMGITTLGSRAQEIAFSKVANEGQNVLVSAIPMEAWFEAARDLVNNLDPIGAADNYLIPETTHPEAIGLLLQETMEELSQSVGT